ncbi:MAG TPA: AAA family ATPase [Anaerolineales bacterium]|jgi:DNA-binding SARP family transcriptional activator
MLQICLLGSFKLDYEGAPIALGSTRLQSLLAYILLHRQSPISRQQLAAVFWPETSEGQSRTNLRNLIFQLRQAIPFIDAYLRSDAFTLEWIKGSAYFLDVESFERCLVMQPGKAVRQAALQQAVTLYTGDLLPACYDEWLVPFRTRLHEAHFSALEALAALAEDLRDYHLALNYALQLVQADPLHPAANEKLVRLHALLGDRPAALKAYQAYSALLMAELGTQPDLDLQALHRQLQQLEAMPAAPHPHSSTPLVGRKAEWHQLLSLWQIALKGQSKLVFITGEAGIGKTRLVEELASWASPQGIPVNTASCYPAEGNMPYAPVVTWIRALKFPKLEKVWLAEIGRLLPEIKHSVHGLPRVAPIHEAWQRQRLFEALARALLVSRQPQLLVLEDIHWADQDTLEWLHFLLRFSPQAPLLIVVTLRSGEIAPDHPLGALQLALRSEQKFNELKLWPLSEQESVQLASYAHQQGSGRSLSDETAGRIFHKSEGNPLFVIELVRLDQLRSGQPAAEDEALVDSERIQALMSRRLSQLNPQTRELTALAAIIGRSFKLDVLLQAGGESEEHIVPLLDDLLHRHIIREISPEAYDFTHDLLRQAVFSELTMVHRRLLHRKVADAYLRLDQDSPHPRHAEIASHYERAGLYSQAVHYYRLAADSAAELFANSDVHGYLERAIGLAESVGSGASNEVSRFEFGLLLVKMGDLSALDGKFPQALAFYERALAQPVPESKLWRSQVYRKMSAAQITPYHHPGAHQALDQAEQTLQFTPGRGDNPDEQAEWLEIQLERIQLFYWDNHPAQMETIIRQVEPIVEASGSIAQKITFLSVVILERLRIERFRPSDDTLAVARRRLELAEAAANPSDLAWAKFQYGFVLLWHDDLLAAREQLLAALEAYEPIGDQVRKLRCLAYLCVLDRKLENLARLRQENPRVLQLAREFGEDNYLGLSLANQGWLAWRAGETVQAVALCQAAKQAWGKIGQAPFNGLADWVLLSVAVSQADFAQAERAGLDLLDPDTAHQAALEPMAGLLATALSACRAQDWGSALQFFNQALAAARQAHEL